jgi:hypothetical protein
MSLIQCELTIDLPYEIGSAWKTPVGRWLLEGAEERGAVPRRHSLQHRQVKLEHALAGVEDAAEVRAEPARDVFDLDLGHEIEVQLRAQLVQ